MYNHQLDTFIATAELGSFSAVAEKLYISPSAVSQQISNLEKYFDCALFYRTNHGVELTEIGAYIYDESTKLRDRSKAILRTVHEMKTRRNNCITLGISDLFLPNQFYSYWILYARTHRTCSIQTVIYNTGETTPEHRAKPDIIEHIKDGELWQKDYSFVKLGTTPIEIAVPPSHPLAGLPVLSLNDLRPYELVNTPSPVHCPALDRLSAMLEGEGIRTINPDKYDQQLLTYCALNNLPVQIPGVWARRISGMVIKSVDWDIELDTGLFYNPAAGGPVADFIDFVKESTCSAVL